MSSNHTCKHCMAENCAIFPADVRIYLNGARSVSAPPINPAPNVVICLECGWSEFVVAPSWLAARWIKPIVPPSYLAASPTAIGGD
jgi:hypothetical protein